MIDSQIRQAQLNASAQTIEEGRNLVGGIVFLSRIHLGLCAIIFATCVAQGTVGATWKLGLPVTALGLPGLINFKKLSDKADKGFALQNEIS